MLREKCMVGGLAALAIPFGVTFAPPASAECTSAGYATICADGQVRGGGPTPPSAAPVYPSYCADPWYCDDNFGVDVSWPIRPGGGIGGPGGPGGPGRPGGGGGIGPR